MKNIQIIPAILSKTADDAVKKISSIDRFASYLQIDIMDGKFVIDKTIPISKLKKIKTDLKLEYHLMVKKPAKYIDDAFHADAWAVIFHIESCENAKEVEKAIRHIKRRKMKIGIALNPETSALELKPYLKKTDIVLVMTVHPGKGGQKFIPEMLKKVKQVRKWNKRVEIEVDGGINKTNIKLAVKAGANRLVVGSGIFAKQSPAISIKHLQSITGGIHGKTR